MMFGDQDGFNEKFGGYLASILESTEGMTVGEVVDMVRDMPMTACVEVFMGLMDSGEAS